MILKFNEHVNNDYFSEVNSEVLSKLGIEYTLVEFNDNELSTIINTFKEYKGYWRYNKILGKDKFSIVCIDRENKLSRIFFYIYKIDDEWYYVINNITNKIYKCDQFEGLLKNIDFQI